VVELEGVTEKGGTDTERTDAFPGVIVMGIKGYPCVEDDRGNTCVIVVEGDDVSMGGEAAPEEYDGGDTGVEEEMTLDMPVEVRFWSLGLRPEDLRVMDDIGGLLLGSIS
jgi:hypothetical protein